MTEITDILRAELGRLAVALEPHGIPLIIGGGYGLLLRQEHLETVKVDVRRIRNRKTKGIHAHTAPEAFTIGEEVMVLDPGGAGEFRVRIPHPYSFLLLKLYAYRDRRDDSAKELGRYHAFDLHRIVAMMTEEEYETAEGFRDRFGGEEVVVEARRIVSDLFADVDSRGTLALLEHARTVGVTIRDEDLDGFLEDLKFFFPALT